MARRRPSPFARISTAITSSISPSRRRASSPAVAESARALACAVAEKLDLVGLLAVEMFLLPDSTLLVNELAPRPHNSGHYTFDACVTSQFEQQLRAICGLPSARRNSCAPPPWPICSATSGQMASPTGPPPPRFPDVKIHLYGKTGPRPGRKMGHLTALATDTDSALAMVRDARASLTP